MKRADFLQRLFLVAGFGSFEISTLKPKRKIYLQQFFVAGFRHYAGMQLLPEMEVNDFLELRREPENAYDEFAIGLYWQQEKIGFIPAEENEMLARLLDAQALPLLAVITHLNREVKPWENVVAAVYFLQEEQISIPAHAAYLQQLLEPEYRTSPGASRKKLLEQFFENTQRIVYVPDISFPQIKAHFEKYSDAKKAVRYNSKVYALVNTDDIYTFMYQVYPLQWITADDGAKYFLFEYRSEKECR